MSLAQPYSHSPYISDLVENKLKNLFYKSNSNIIDNRGLGKGKTFQANEISKELANNEEYVIRVLPRYDIIHEQMEKFGNEAMVAYGRPYEDMCALCDGRGQAIAGGICEYCNENKKECKFQEQIRRLKQGEYHIIFTVPQMLPFVLQICDGFSPLIIIDDCNINEIVYPRQKNEYSWFGKVLFAHPDFVDGIRDLFGFFEKRDDKGAENWINSHHGEITATLKKVRKAIIEEIDKGTHKIHDLIKLAHFLAICENRVTLKGRGEGVTISCFNSRLIFFRFIYQNGTLLPEQRETIAKISGIRGLEVLDEKCQPNENWRILAIDNVKYTSQSVRESKRFKEIYGATLHALTYIEEYTGKEFAEFSQKKAFDGCLLESRDNLPTIKHFNHYGNGVSGCNSISNYYSVVLAGTLSPHPSFFDCYPYISQNRLDTIENGDFDYPVSREVVNAITDTLKEQEMGRILRYDGENEHRQKIIILIGTAPKYEERDGIKYLPNSGAIVIEVKPEQFLKAVLESLRDWLEEAIIAHTLSEKPRYLNEFSKKVVERIGGKMTYKTVERLIEQSGRFKIELKTEEGNNKAKKVFIWS